MNNNKVCLCYKYYKILLNSTIRYRHANKTQFSTICPYWNSEIRIKEESEFLASSEQNLLTNLSSHRN